MWKARITFGTALLVMTAQAQVSTNVTCPASMSWMANFEGQNPCLVAAYLSAVCNNGAWTVPNLVGSGPYDPPEGSGVNTCRCNVDVYSLLSACSYCQGGAVGTWSDWIAFCPSSYIHDSYPEKVPDQTDIPSWADLNITATGVWNATAAQQFAAFVTLSPSRNSSSDGKKTNVGAIVGGMIGGVASIALLAAIVWLLIFRSSYGKGQRVTSAPYTDAGLEETSYALGSQGYEQGGYRSRRLDMGTPGPHVPLMVGQINPYDPSDPNRFPASSGYRAHSPAPTSTIVGHSTGTPYQSYPVRQQDYPHHQQLQHPPGDYSGAPEV